jgi:hypothetical protein
MFRVAVTEGFEDLAARRCCDRFPVLGHWRKISLWTASGGVKNSRLLYTTPLLATNTFP